MKQQVIVKLCQSLPHLLRHRTVLIIMLKTGQQKNLEEKQSETPSSAYFANVLLLNVHKAVS